MLFNVSYRAEKEGAWFQFSNLAQFHLPQAWFYYFHPKNTWKVAAILSLAMPEKLKDSCGFQQILKVIR